MTSVIAIIAVLGIGFVMWALCRACSIYDEWSARKEYEDWQRYVYQDDGEDDEDESNDGKEN